MMNCTVVHSVFGLFDPVKSSFRFTIINTDTYQSNSFKISSRIGDYFPKKALKKPTLTLFKPVKRSKCSTRGNMMILCLSLANTTF